MKPTLNPNLIKIAYWLRVNGPATKEQIESATGIPLTTQLVAQGDWTGLLVYVEPLGLFA